MLRRKRLGVIAASTLISASALLGVSAAPAVAVAASPQSATASTATHGRPTAQVIPNISFAECSGTVLYRSWVNIDILQVSGLMDWCFGFTGTWQFHAPNNNVTFFCSGNNIGVYHYIQNGVIHFFNFRPGQLHTFAANVRAYSLTIQGWTGSDTCPYS
jgi:hypothetical protein